MLETFNLVGGSLLEAGATLFYLATASLLHDDVNSTHTGCNGPGMPCAEGSPIVLVFPIGAIGLGWLGAGSLANGRAASIWRSPIFWAGTGVSVGAYVIASVTARQQTRDERLTWDTAFLAGAISGTAMQIWGAMTAPPRRLEPAAQLLHVAPGCGPTSGGVLCGLALAGF